MRSIGVIVPSWHYWEDPLKHQPYWELYYATVLESQFAQNGSSVDVVDLRGIPGDTLPTVVRHIPERDLYVYWIMKSGDAIEVYSIAKLLREQYPRSIHVAGGTHVDMCTEECQVHFDAVVVGPGEHAFVQVVNDLQTAHLATVYRQSYHEVPFSDTPFPRREFLPVDRVVNTELFKQYGGQRGTLVYFSRGCVYRCAFCVYNVPDTLQVRSPQMMRAELRYLKEQYKIEGVLLKDEVAIHPNPRLSTRTFEALGEANVIWRGQTTTLASDEQLRMARESGCQELAVGVETVDEQVMKIINKAWQTQRQIREFVANAKQRGIRVKICLIFGLPGEPPDIVDRTIQFIGEIQPDYVSLSGFCPLPGSPMFRNPESYGIKSIDRDWSKHAHLLYRFSDDEEVGLPFEYAEQTPWGKAFTRPQIIENIRQLQHYLRQQRMVY